MKREPHAKGVTLTRAPLENEDGAERMPPSVEQVRRYGNFKEGRTFINAVGKSEGS